ncbi:hypothetical protein FNO01nite_20430 [Flavobacterium noncentrifugens]|uniref:Copper chaperone n=1 Tax=Flavobacterium noncentrifugens TaxID=1128970 RepID=A0A1G8YV13_9FLAO|nr:hypothetical protein [Flavobacterium noncentrifugens]GEP51371.1 hypothetical protein FNO01nite_20430 [Flavobacterium noncentrifugens]SDK06658.1 hypothetical protein SAMN04487935_2488 [Flavobacterium noncentrifugens]
METNLNHILVFKTNIDQLSTDCALSESLGKQTGISQWSIDHEDCDRVLRIVSKTLSNHDIISLINAHGFECAELP